MLLALGVLAGAWGASARPAPAPRPLRVVEAPEHAAAPLTPSSPSPAAEVAEVAAVPAVSVPRAAVAPTALSALVEGEDEGGPIGVDTPLELEQIGRILGVAHRQLYGVYPGPERWLIAWAHVAHEIGRGRTCVENNLGNIVVSLRWPGGWHLRRVQERLTRGSERWVVQRVRFRSYETPMEGALDYWRVISGHFGSALPLFDAGDAAAAGRLLCERGYSTAPCEAYGAGLRGLYSELRARPEYPPKRLLERWEALAQGEMVWPNLRPELSQDACHSRCSISGEGALRPEGAGMLGWRGAAPAPWIARHPAR
jgi:hypothetical protein